MESSLTPNTSLNCIPLSPDDVMDIREMLEEGKSKEEVLDIYLSKGFEADRVHYYVNDMDRILNKNKQIRINDFGAPLANTIYAFGIPIAIIVLVLSTKFGKPAIVLTILILLLLGIIFLVSVVNQFIKEKKKKTWPSKN